MESTPADATFEARDEAREIESWLGHDHGLAESAAGDRFVAQAVVDAFDQRVREFVVGMRRKAEGARIGHARAYDLRGQERIHAPHRARDGDTVEHVVHGREARTPTGRRKDQVNLADTQAEEVDDETDCGAAAVLGASYELHDRLTTLLPILVGKAVVERPFGSITEECATIGSGSTRTSGGSRPTRGMRAFGGHGASRGESGGRGRGEAQGAPRREVQSRGFCPHLQARAFAVDPAAQTSAPDRETS